MRDVKDKLKATDDEFEKLKNSLNSARSLFEEAKYDQAESEYFAGLRLAESLGMMTEKIECLNGLGACYYEGKKYIESKAVYQQLVNDLPEDVDQELKTLILLRFAHSTDKLEDFDAAHEIYEQTFLLAEECLEPGEALLTEVYEAYASILRRAKRDPEKLILLEKKVRINRQKQAGITDSPLDLYEPKKEEVDDDEDEFADYKRYHSLLGKFERLAKKRPTLTICLLTSPVLLAGLALISVIVLSIFGIDIGTTKLYSSGDKFALIDYPISLTIDDSKATLKVGEIGRQLNFRNLSRWSQFLSLANNQQSDQYWLLPTKYGFKGEDGLYFIKQGSPVFKYKEVLLKCSEAIEKYRKEKDELPKSTKQFINSGYRFPKIENYKYRVSSYRDNEDESPIKIFESLLNHNGRLWQFPNSDTFSGNAPVILNCIVPENSNNHFFIVPTDGTNFPLRSSYKANLTALFWTKGAAPKIYSDNSEFPTFTSARTFAVSDRKKSAVKAKYGHVIVAIVIFFFLVVVGGFAIKPLKEKKVHWKYRSRQQGSYSEGLLLGSFLLMCMIYMGYVFYIIL